MWNLSKSFHVQSVSRAVGCTENVSPIPVFVPWAACFDVPESMILFQNFVQGPRPNPSKIAARLHLWANQLDVRQAFVSFQCFGESMQEVGRKGKSANERYLKDSGNVGRGEAM